MQILRTTGFATLGLTTLASAAFANAFNINEHDARVTGRGGASAASNTEPSSIVFNPGGIAVNAGTQLAIGGAVYLADGSYEDSDGKVNTDSKPSVVPSFYLTSRVHDMVAIGLGVHLPFGLAVSWPDPPAHRQADVIQDQSLRTYFITPSVGLNLHEQVPGLSLGGGVDIVPATIELRQAILFGDTTGSAHLGGDAIGIGGRVGVMYHPPALAQLKLGAMYRSAVKLDFEGEGDFDIAEEYRSQLPADGAIAATVTLPQSAALGVAYQPFPALELEVDAVWIDWSNAFEDGDLTIALPGDRESRSPQDYEDTITFRAGIEYRLLKARAALRAGFVYDPTPIPTTTLTARLPDIDRKNVTLGASKLFGDYGVHLGLLWVTPGERETSDTRYMPAFKGRYGVQAFVASLGVSAAFGAR